MQTEMNKLFAEGGVMQEGGTVDPVSGNDVPIGSMAEEVRDDIPAQFSEGEFVVAADVVRYIGLEKLMAMRDKAKMGLQKMADIGQMGNADEVEDADSLFGGEDDMDDDTFSSEIDTIMADSGGGEPREFNEGGFVLPQNQQLYRDAPIKGFEMVPMTNDAGQTIFIPFINGVAQLNVPAGYKVKTAGAVDTPVVETPAAPAQDGGGDGPSVSDGGSLGGGNTDGSTPGGGQGISNTAIDAGLAAMAFGQSKLGKAVSAVLGIPLSTAANIGGTAVVDAQMDAISNSFNAMDAAQSSNLSGQIGTVSDESGNISTVSNQGITDAFDLATFGTTSQGMSDAAAANAAQAAETGMTTNAAGQTVSSDASIAAQDAAIFGGSDGGGGDSGTNSDGTSGPGDSAGLSSGGGQGVDGMDGDGSAGGGGGGGGGGCFLTTAAVEHMGHNDDGQLLNTLRDFRDTYMRKNKEASKDVAWYYENSPKIVKALDEHPDAKKIYRKMYNRFIMPAYMAIRKDNLDSAYSYYKKAVDFAKKESDIDNKDIAPRHGKNGTTDADVKKHTGLGAKSKK